MRGHISSPLPYGVLSEHDRGTAVQLPAIELGNGCVRALVLPSLGAGYGPLVDEASGRDLVHRNPRLRWANLASSMRGSWRRHRVESRLDRPQHHLQPARARRHLDTPLGSGGPPLGLGRTRDLVLQIDLWLSGARLMASTRVHSRTRAQASLLRTNIAVPETPRTRVLVPADSAWRTDYAGVLERVGMPFPD